MAGSDWNGAWEKKAGGAARSVRDDDRSSEIGWASVQYKAHGLLAEADFDAWIEQLCEPYYSDGKGRPGIPPGVYFRMLLVGHFEGISSQRGIAWRCANSLSLRSFLGITLTQDTPDHSSLTYIRERLPREVHEAVFKWVLKLASDKKLLKGTTVAVDSTTLEASAAMKSIVRRDTGEDWREQLSGLPLAARDAAYQIQSEARFLEACHY